MNSKYQIFLRARRRLHDKLKIPVIIYPKAGGSPIETFARVHYGYGFVGDQLGTNFNYVEISDYKELNFLFWIEETPEVKYGDIVTVPWGKTYTMDAHQLEDKWTYKVMGAMVPPEREGLYEYPNG